MDWSVCLKRVVNPVFVVVTHVLADEAPQMAFIQCNHMIEKLTATTSDPAFREPVLPGRLHTCALRRQPCRFQKLNDVGIEISNRGLE